MRTKLVILKFMNFILRIFTINLACVGIVFSEDKDVNKNTILSCLTQVSKSMVDDKSSKLLFCPRYVEAKDDPFSNGVNSISVFGFGYVQGDEMKTFLENILLNTKNDDIVLITSPLYNIDLYFITEKQISDKKIDIVMSVHEEYIAVCFPQYDKAQGGRLWYKLSEKSYQIFKNRFVKSK
jgi:hypothetical protein